MKYLLIQSNRKVFFILAFFISLIVTFFPLSYSGPAIIVMLGVFLGLAVSLCLYSNSAKEAKFIFYIFISAFLLRLTFSFIFHQLSFTEMGYRPGFLLANDSWGYSVNGERILHIWRAGLVFNKEVFKSQSQSGTVAFYDIWNALVYSVLGVNPLNMFFINSFIGALSIVFVYDIAKNIHNVASARLVSYAMLVWPSLVLWSTQNFKEPIVLLLISILLWAILKLTKEFRFYLLFLVIFSTIALKEFRGFVVIALYLLVLPATLFFNSLFKKEKRLVFIFLCITVVGPVLYIILDTYFSFNLMHIKNFLKYAHQMRNFRTYGDSAFLVGWDFTNISKLIIFLPLSLLVTWLAPFPWQIKSAQQVIAMPEMVFFYLLIPFIFHGVNFILRNKIKQGTLIILYVSFISCILAMIEGNIGTLFRHKAMILPFCFILAAIGWDRRRFKFYKVIKKTT